MVVTQRAISSFEKRKTISTLVEKASKFRRRKTVEIWQSWGRGQMPQKFCLATQLSVKSRKKDFARVLPPWNGQNRWLFEDLASLKNVLPPKNLDAGTATDNNKNGAKWSRSNAASAKFVKGLKSMSWYFAVILPMVSRLCSYNNVSGRRGIDPNSLKVKRYCVINYKKDSSGFLFRNDSFFMLLYFGSWKISIWKSIRFTGCGFIESLWYHTDDILLPVWSM